MSTELWRPSLDLALHRNRQSPQARFVQLATVREDGRPAVRTIVWRGFLEDGARLIFATDSRARKWTEIGASPWGEACWYFHVTREQFRLGGPLSVVDESTTDRELLEVRVATWREMSAESRLTYTWPDPGRARVPLAPFPTVPPDPLEPLPHFGLLVLDVSEVDHLELVGNPQHRWEYKRDEYGRWSAAEINP
ncbi:Npun_F5749 family FMN-dependent PPOX-type flavoprotein [Aquisphaera insulae]|uniref:Npun_F5749 family FMN-dependent PPOX-type flavoprotein n=1 Tax=Aquisphaera insulae TaxID=2712864 RepID=UPI0013ED4B62|nr:Npun_F5749 family FMN-dependent PPOX-type flavoprotein [Aquisphaera insulae]